MKIYKVVKREENPTISLSKVSMEDGFLIVISNGEAIGIIVHDDCKEQYIMITYFNDSFESGINADYYDENLEKLIEEIRKDYTEPVELNFVRITQ